MNGPIAPPPAVPAYGRRSLGEVIPSMLSSLGVASFANALALPPAKRVCLLLIDGLGWELLRGQAQAAPFLNSLADDPLTAGFPATTAASLTSIATGLPPGEHGVIGYTMALPGADRAFNALTWSYYGLGPRVDLREELVPERFQPEQTLAQKAVAAGIQIQHLGPGFHERSGLTRAIGGGERFHAADSLSAVTELALALLRRGQPFVTGYYPALDAAGHVHGVASQVWQSELINIDNGIRSFAEQLAAGTLLVITGDHGMADLRPQERLDLADDPDLAAGVELLAGEARARYLRTRPGATSDVVDAWRGILGDRMWVWTREEAIATGVFGPVVTHQARERIGDIVSAAYGTVGVFQRDVDPAQARFNGHHGSLTPAEQSVPLLVYRA